MVSADLSILEPLPPRTIMQVEVGSTAHGTGIPGHEDFDVLAVYAESLDQIFNPLDTGSKNVMQRTQPDGVKSGPEDIDRTIFPLRNFFKLCVNGNPSVMLALWAPVIESNGFGRLVRNNAHLFVAKSIIPRFQGYMRSNMGKLREGGRQDLIEEFGYDTKAAMHAIRLGHQCIELIKTRELMLPIGETAGDELRSIRRGEQSFDYVTERAESLNAEIDNLRDVNYTQETPDLEKITELSRTIHEAGFVGI